MSKFIHVLLGAAALSLTGGIAAVNLAPIPVIAQVQSNAKMIVDQAIREGVIGETAAGYLAMTGTSASPEVTNAMNEVNIGRKTVYTRLARQKNVSIEVVAALTGEQQILSAPQGTKILNKQGRWVTVQ